MTDFINDFPDLKEQDIQLMVYCVAGLSVPAICTLLGVNPTQFYTRKSRIRGKVAESAAVRKNEYLTALS